MVFLDSATSPQAEVARLESGIRASGSVMFAVTDGVLQAHEGRRPYGRIYREGMMR
jgi:hypothetical protein